MLDADKLDDLFDVVDTVARLVGGPVAVEDVDFRVLAYSAVPGQPNDEARRSAILNRRTPDRWLRWMDESGLRDQLLISEEIVRLDIPWAAFQPRHIKPIRSAGRLVGYLWVMEGTSPLAVDFERICHDFAELLAPELVRRTHALAEEPGGQALRQFLNGGLPAFRMAELLGVGETTTAVVIVVHVMVAAPDAVASRARAVRALSQFTQLQLRSCVVGNVDQEVYLLHARPSMTVEDLQGLLEPAARHLERALDLPVKAAAGGLRAELGQAEASRREADLALRVLLADPRSSTTGCFDRMRVAIVLHEVVDLLRSRPELVQGLVDPLIDHDREHGTAYVRTLEVYLDVVGDVRGAAERLHIHPNSLRYRLRRIEAIAGLDLASGEHRLAVQLALTARRAR